MGPAKQHSDEASRSGRFASEWMIDSTDPDKTPRREKFPTEWTMGGGDEENNPKQLQQSEGARQKLGPKSR